MIGLCKKLEAMIKDEKKGAQEYEDIQFEMTAVLGKGTSEDHIDTLDLIACDEDRHGVEIKQIMKDLKCK